MSVNYNDFFELAKQLEPSEKEIDWRTCAARTYYAAFHRASTTALLCPDNENFKMGSHERLTDRFELHKSKNALAIAYVLKGMKKVRHVADYELDGVFFKGMSSSQIATYNSLLDRLNSFEEANTAKTA